MRTFCFFNTTPFWGGGEKWHLEAALEFRRRGHDVVVVGVPGSPLVQRARAAGLDVSAFRLVNRSWLNVAKLWRLRRFFGERGVGTVIFNGPADLKAGGLGAMLAGVPQRVYRRGLALPVRANPLNRFLFRRVVTHVVANSIATRLALFGELGDIVPDERVAVIPNGIDLARFDRRSEASTFRLDGDVVTVGTVGRLTVQKNHDALLDIARTMLDRDLDVRVCIGGDGELADALRAKSDRIGLGERVSFVGFVDDVPGFMKAIDIFVLTSTWEGFGYVIIEAGAAGRPTVAFDLSSNPEVVVDGETGFLVAPGDHDAFVVCLKRLAEDDLLRDEMGSAARRHVEASFTHGHVMDQLETFLLGETTQG